MPSSINTRFVLAEESALKAKFQGLAATNFKDESKPHPVDVWFSWPDPEIRKVTYPFIAISFADIQRAAHREHQGAPYPLEYLPHGHSAVPDPDTGALMADEWPVPYDLYHTVTVVTLDPRHDREMNFRIIGDRDLLPGRWGYLPLEDETVRRLDLVDTRLLEGRNRDGLREFRRVFTVRTETELHAGTVQEVRRAGTLRLFLTETVTGISEEVPIST